MKVNKELNFYAHVYIVKHTFALLDIFSFLIVLYSGKFILDF